MKTQKIKLGDIVIFFYGKGLPEEKRKVGCFPVYGSSGIVDYHEKFLVTGPGIIVGRKGNVGSVYFEKNNFFPIDTVYYIKTICETVNLKYLYYLLQYLPLDKLNSDAAVPGLNRENALKVKISLPSLNNQQKISSILSAYDDLIDINCRRIKRLEEAARLLYREWFVYFRFPGHEKVKIVNGVPEGWEKEKIKKLGIIVTGKTPSKKISRNFGGNIPFIKTPDMHRSAIVSNTEESLSEIGANSQNNKYLPPWSIQVSCIGTVGIVTMNLFKAQTNQQINSVIPKKNIYRYYSYFCLSQLRTLLEAIGGGSTMANVNKSKFENLDIIIPNEDILEKFHEAVDAGFKQIATLLQQSQKLSQARDLLLPRLMSGRLEV